MDAPDAVIQYTTPKILSPDHSVYGIGFDPSIDWLRLTWESRIVKDAGPYREVGYAWQYMLDWSLLNFPRVYHQLARGHDKTERETWWMLLWGLTAPHGQGYCCGVDKENAQLYKIAAEWIVENHPDIFSDWKIHNYDLKNKRNGCHIRILASDEQSNYGLTPDLVLATDLHGWTNKGFWTAIHGAMGKRPNARMWLESNALALGTEQIHWIRPIRDFAKDEHERTRGKGLKPGPGENDKRWFFYAPPMFLAPWQKNQLREWAGMWLPSAFRRFVMNQDSSEGNQYLTEEQVAQCEREKGPHAPRPGATTVVTTDLGLSTDAACVAVVSEYVIKGVQYIDCNEMVVFTGSRDQPVNIDTVVACANSFAKLYRARKFCDPWEMRHVMQQDASWEEYTLSPNNIKNITSRLWRTVVGKRARLWKNMAPAMQVKGGGKPRQWDLKTELTEAVLKDTSYGQRVDHKSAGFTDRLMALGMGLDILYQEPHPPEFKPEPPARIRSVDERTMGEMYDKIMASYTPDGVKVI